MDLALLHNNSNNNLNVNSKITDEDCAADETAVRLFRVRQRYQFFKTRLCPRINKKLGSNGNGVCPNGDSCSYAHSLLELRPPVNLSKTKMCQNFVANNCNLSSEQCHFAHGLSELQAARPYWKQPNIDNYYQTAANTVSNTTLSDDELFQGGKLSIAGYASQLFKIPQLAAALEGPSPVPAAALDPTLKAAAAAAARAAANEGAPSCQFLTEQLNKVASFGTTSSHPQYSNGNSSSSMFMMEQQQQRGITNEETTCGSSSTLNMNSNGNNLQSRSSREGSFRLLNSKLGRVLAYQDAGAGGMVGGTLGRGASEDSVNMYRAAVVRNFTDQGLRSTSSTSAAAAQQHLQLQQQQAIATPASFDFFRAPPRNYTDSMAMNPRTSSNEDEEQLVTALAEATRLCAQNMLIVRAAASCANGNSSTVPSSTGLATQGSMSIESQRQLADHLSTIVVRLVVREALQLSSA